MVSVNNCCLQFSNSRAVFESPFQEPSKIFLLNSFGYNLGISSVIKNV